MTFGERLRSLRESRGKTQDEVGIAVGKTGKAVWTWENDINAPRMGVVEKLAQYFNVSKSYLMGEDEKAPASLTQPEAELVSCYRQLNRAGRDMLLSTARAFAGNPDMTEEKESAQAM